MKKLVAVVLFAVVAAAGLSFPRTVSAVARTNAEYDYAFCKERDGNMRWIRCQKPWRAVCLRSPAGLCSCYCTD